MGLSPAETVRFCRTSLEKVANFGDHILELLDASTKGYSMREILWDVSEKDVTVTSLNWIHPKRITFRDSLAPKILTKVSTPAGSILRPSNASTAAERFPGTLRGRESCASAHGCIYSKICCQRLGGVHGSPWHAAEGNLPWAHFSGFRRM